MSKLASTLSKLPRGFRLKDKVCIITGAGSLQGIGRASALKFAHEGARHLYLFDKNGANFAAIKSDIEGRYPEVKVTTVEGDSSHEATISDLCELALENEGRLDVFFAGAGTLSAIPGLESYSPSHLKCADEFMRVMKINALSSFLALKHASQAMSKVETAAGKTASGGSIVMASSMAAKRAAGTGLVEYSASKAAILSMVQTGSYENQCLRNGVRVNAICPGLILTQLSLDATEAARARVLAGGSQDQSVFKFGRPEEVANLVAFLASDEASHINGQGYVIDDGNTNYMAVDKIYVE